MAFDLLRAIAAIAVLVGHSLTIFPLWDDPRQWMQQYGVVVFFLLSGFLISRTLHRRLDDPKSTFADYAIDRWSRIYSGFLPAIFLVALIDYFATSGTMSVLRETAERFTFGLFLSNIFMLQAPTVSLTFGSAGPFWTVAIEFWIYMFVGLLAFGRRDGFSPWTIVGIALTGIIPVQSLTENFMVLVPWLLGAAIERSFTIGTVRRTHLILVLAIGACAAALLVRNAMNYGAVYSLKTYLETAIVFAALALLSERAAKPPAWLATVAAWFANWSYSLYLLHHSILLLIAWGFGAYIGPYWGIAASVVTSISFAGLTEVHHHKLASHLKRLWRTRSAKTATQAIVP